MANRINAPDISKGKSHDFDKRIDIIAEYPNDKISLVERYDKSVDVKIENAHGFSYSFTFDKYMKDKVGRFLLKDQIDQMKVLLDLED